MTSSKCFRRKNYLADDVLENSNAIAEVLQVVKLKVKTYLQLKPTPCRILLQQYKYDKDRLIEAFVALVVDKTTIRYYESEDQDAFFSAARLVSLFANEKKASLKSSSDQPFKSVCDICFTSLPTAVG